MGTWALLQVVVDIFAALGFFIIVMRMSRQPKDDPRLSRGLQLLQSKISVLEDLSDRTENQVSQLSALLDQKGKEVQAKVQIAERMVHEIKVSMERSLDVAKIFQDKIPHQEIIERQNTIKYVQAARLAHQGLTPEQIAMQIDLPKGEIEFIAKVNRDQLMFNEDQLPWWAKGGTDDATGGLSAQAEFASPVPAPSAEMEESTDAHAARLRAEIEIAERQRLYDNLSRLQFEMQSLDQQLARESSQRDLSGAFEIPRVESGSLQKLGEEFRRACEDANSLRDKSSVFPPLEQLTSLIPQIFVEDAPVPAPAAAPAHAHMQAPQMLAPAPAPQAQPQAQPPQDPAQARAAAQAKVQAALARSAATAPPPAARDASPVLAAARAMARDAQAPAVPMGAGAQHNQVLNSRASSSAPPPVIRKVEFPKIDSPE